MDLLEEFLTDLRRRDRSPRTVKGYQQDLTAFFAWLKAQTGRDIQPVEVTTFDVRKYCDHKTDAGCKPATVNRLTAALRSFFTWAEEQGHVARNPATSIKPIRQERRAPKGLSAQEVYLLQRRAAERRQLALLLWHRLWRT